ncbi:MAG: hypothetical protein WC285_02065 [Candidatus Gracilibacteria bacterium]|jgi:hypothetical protein
MSTKKILVGMIVLSLILTTIPISRAGDFGYLTPDVKPEPKIVTCSAFTYTGWGSCDCSISKMYRNILTSGPAGCVGGSPSLSAGCTCEKQVEVLPVVKPVAEPQQVAQPSAEEVEVPKELKDVKSDEVYESKVVEDKALSLVLADKEECSGENAEKCINEKVYGLYNNEKPLTENEITKAVVFHTDPNTVVETPKMVNVHGKVGSKPAFLAVSKANEEISIQIFMKKYGKYVPVMTVKGTTDEDGKIVLVPSKNLPSGQYKAEISTTRKTAEVAKASVLNSSTTADTLVAGQASYFTVEGAVDKEFYISNVEVKKENVHEPYAGEVTKTVKYLLDTMNKINPKFDVAKYVESARTGGQEFFTKGKLVRSGEVKNDAMIYLTYQSVILGSAIIADASQSGEFRVQVPKGLQADTHTLTVYAYDPKLARTSSLQSLIFRYVR